MTTALFAMRDKHLQALFPPPLLNRLGRLVKLEPGRAVLDFADPRVSDALARTEILLTGPGCPPIDEAALDRAPWLRAILHAGAGVHDLVTSACWDRGIRVSSAADADSVPPAEFTLAAILLAGKDTFAQATEYQRSRGKIGRVGCPGNFGRCIGIVGATRTGRRVIEMLRPFDVEILVYDPQLDEDEAAWLQVGYLDLDRLLATSDVVTLHVDLTPGTRGLLDARRLALLPDGATLINTAHGALVDTEALTYQAVHRRVNAVLDVTEPQPLPADSPLYELPNVLLTPRLAGPLGGEPERIGRCVVDELERLVAGRPLVHRVLPGDRVHP